MEEILRMEVPSISEESGNINFKMKGGYKLVISRACNQKRDNQKSVPWWTQELTIRRKKLNAIRRRYQRTQDRELRETSNKTYHTEKSHYQAAIKREKISHGKNSAPLQQALTLGM